MKAIDLDTTWAECRFPSCFGVTPEIVGQEAERLDLQISTAEVCILVGHYTRLRAENHSFWAWYQQVGSSDLRWDIFIPMRIRQLQAATGITDEELEGICSKATADIKFPPPDYEGPYGPDGLEADAEEPQGEDPDSSVDSDGSAKAQQ